MSNPRFYILSLKHSRGDVLAWWGANNRGYTTSLDDAGEYTAEQIDSRPEYYNNGDSTRAVPTTTAMVVTRHVDTSTRRK